MSFSLLRKKIKKEFYSEMVNEEVSVDCNLYFPPYLDIPYLHITKTTKYFYIHEISIFKIESKARS